MHLAVYNENIKCIITIANAAALIKLYDLIIWLKSLLRVHNQLK